MISTQPDLRKALLCGGPCHGRTVVITAEAWSWTIGARDADASRDWYEFRGLTDEAGNFLFQWVQSGGERV